MAPASAAGIVYEYNAVACDVGSDYADNLLHSPIKRDCRSVERAQYPGRPLRAGTVFNRRLAGPAKRSQLLFHPFVS
jgi:hypothetical protein